MFSSCGSEPIYCLFELHASLLYLVILCSAVGAGDAAAPPIAKFLLVRIEQIWKN